MVPKEIDLSCAVGECSTQIKVGKFDIQFSLGKIWFAIMCPIQIFENDKEIGKWEEGSWPDKAFSKVLNVNMAGFEIPNQEFIILRFESGVEMIIRPETGPFESLTIGIEGVDGPWFI
jgi:hypothetical protein